MEEDQDVTEAAEIERGDRVRFRDDEGGCIYGIAGRSSRLPEGGAVALLVYKDVGGLASTFYAELLVMSALQWCRLSSVLPGYGISSKEMCQAILM